MSAADADRIVAGLLRGFRGLGAVEIDDDHMRAVVGEQLRRRGSDRAAAAGHQRDLAGQRLRLVGGELGLLQRPVFEREQIGLGKRAEVADRLGAAHRLDPHLADIRRDLRILQRAAMAEHADARNQRQARHLVEHGALDVVERVIRLEIGAVVGGELRDVLLHDGAVVAELAGVGRRQRHRAGLDADRQVRRRDAARGIVGDLGRLDEIEDRVRGAEIADHAVEAAFALVATATAPRSIGAISAGFASFAGSAIFAGRRLAVPGDEILGQRHRVDHAVIGLPGDRRRR